MPGYTKNTTYTAALRRRVVGLGIVLLAVMGLDPGSMFMQSAYAASALDLIMPAQGLAVTPPASPKPAPNEKQLVTPQKPAEASKVLPEAVKTAPIAPPTQTLTHAKEAEPATPAVIPSPNKPINYDEAFSPAMHAVTRVKLNDESSKTADAEKAAGPDVTPVAPPPLPEQVAKHIRDGQHTLDGNISDPYDQAFSPGDGPRQDKPAPSSSDAYLVGSGDRLRVSVYGEKDLSTVYLVDGNGQISMPLIGGIAVKGKTLSAIEQAVAQKLQQGFLLEPSVAVEIAEYRPFYMLGEVRRPGSYNFIEGMTVLNAVAVGGGFTYRAKTKEFEIKRELADGKIVSVMADTNTRLQPGDVLTIKERFF